MTDALFAKKNLPKKGSRLHNIHYLVLLFSTTLTIFAWQYTLKQSQEQSRIKFIRENDQIIDLVKERMQKYEDFLWSSRAFIQKMESSLTDTKWHEYAESIRLTEKYPGINGIGIIYNQNFEEKKEFEKSQQMLRPEFKIFPDHEKEEFWPITFISPYKNNQKAIGLDMSHETNRREAAILARDTGLPKFTGPIVLVQDQHQTPGFLFYIPVYEQNNLTSMDDRRKKFICLTYAPFIFKNLVEGVLAKEIRHVSITISDNNTVLYDENIPGEKNFDKNPIFQKETNVPLYGRIWTFNIQSGLSFRKTVNKNQAYTILVCGIFINFMLLALFLSLVKSNKHAINFARKMNENLIQSEKKLKAANEELTQFNYRTSHDLVAPLRTIDGYIYLAQEDMLDKNFELAASYFEKISIQSERLKSLINDLLNLCVADNLKQTYDELNFEEIIKEIGQKLDAIKNEKSVEIQQSINLQQKARANKIRVSQVLENLISNSIKYSDPEKESRFVKIAIKSDVDTIEICVSDNGLGIPKEYHEKVFDMFTKFNNSEFGSGLGTYLVKKHIEAMHGSIEMKSDKQGTKFTVTLPNHSNG